MQINLLLTKEEQLKNLSHSAKTVVILDVLLATSTIIECLAAGAKGIYPVKTKECAFKKRQSLINNHVEEDEICLAGEMNGLIIDGFVNPTPLKLREVVKNKHLILLTTNGTVAIQQAKGAEEIYIASLLNGKAVASHLTTKGDRANIDVVCSGSNGLFSLEDFYGAGHLIHSIVVSNEGRNITLSDSAIAAQLFYKLNHNMSEQILTRATVGRLLINLGLQADLKYVCQKDKYHFVPHYNDGQILIRGQLNEKK